MDEEKVGIPSQIETLSGSDGAGANKPINFGNVEKNRDARNALKALKDLPSEEAFNIVYDNMKEIALKDLDFFEKINRKMNKKGKDNASFLDTKEAKENYVSRIARETTKRAMAWLEKYKKEGEYI